jgi:hypothetical protein
VRRHRPNINLTQALEGVVQDLCARLPEFAHINPRQLLVCMARARHSRGGGVFAKIVPMRFPDGTPFKIINGRQYALSQIPTPQGDILYLIYVYIPRFFEQPFERRLLTLVHELYHIAPAFDGTIRRIGRGAHGNSRDSFNAQLQPFIDRYLASQPVEDTLSILHSDFKVLAREYTLTGRAMSVPKAIQL